MDAELPGHPMDGMEAFDEFENEAADDGMDADFGPLEMFDSNAVAAPFSTQSHDLNSESGGPAPDAVMSSGMPSSPPVSKKSKRDKKSKSKKEKKDASSQDDAAPREEGKHRRAKHSSAFETSAAADALTTLAAAAEPFAQAVDEAQDVEATSSKQKRKRKSPDGASEKKRSKKRRSGGSADLPEVDLHDVDENNGDAAASTAFLRKQDGPDVTAVADEDTNASDPQGSPTIEHLRRLSHSGVAIGTSQDDTDMGQLAQEAWQENATREETAPNRSDENDQEDGADDNDVNQTVAEHTYDSPPEPEIQPEPSGTSTRPKRARAKKAKPTYYEQPPEEPADDDEAADLPSPSAMTPKPRRAKAATKKAKRPRQLKARDEDESDGDGDEDGQTANRRNRMAGYIQGRFTDAELERLSKAVESFRDEKDISQTEVNEMIHAPGGTNAGEAHAQLWTRLFAECPDRHRQKVINITRKKFHNFVARGTWTQEQEDELRSLIDEYGPQWSKIAGLINRHPEDIRDRYRNYIVCGTAQKKDAWTQDEEGRLAQFVIDAMQAIDDLRAQQPTRTLLQKPYEELIDWQNISERMERTRSRLQCITKWKSMHLKMHGKDQLVSAQPDSRISFNLERARRQIAAMPEEERYRLVMAIRDSAASTDSKIPWQKLLDKPFRNDWHRSTQVLLWHRLKKQVPQYESKTVRDCAQFLVDQYNQVRELPDVDGDDWDDVEEMQCVATASSRTKKTPKKESDAAQAAKSAEFVTEDPADVAEPAIDAEPADDEEDEDDEAEDANGEATGVGEEAHSWKNDDMQIDPALTLDPTLADIATEATIKTSSTPKKTPAKQQITYGKRKGSARKDMMLSQDPIEDDDVPGERGQAEIEAVTPANKKRAGSKFKPSATKTQGKRQEAVMDGATAMSSDIDDMSDVPARIITQGEHDI